jgi:hypothetical protein
VPGREAPQDHWESTVRALIRRHGYDVVLASNDTDVVRLVAAQLDTPTVPSMSPAQAVILDKGALATLCARVGVRYPPTDVPSTPHDDELVAARASREAVVKAARPAVLTDGGVVHMGGIIAGMGADGALVAMRRFRGAGLQPVVQQRVSGAKVQAAIIRRAGATSCRVTALVERAPAETTLRQLDSAAGLGGACVAALERVADGAGYEGLLQAEFLASGSGSCLIDVNPRLWGGLSFAELVGLRMTERAVLDALGLPPPPLPPETVGRRYHHVARELGVIAAAPRELPSVLSRWSFRDAWDVPTLKDVRPTILHLWQQARGPRGRARPPRPGR